MRLLIFTSIAIEVKCKHALDDCQQQVALLWILYRILLLLTRGPAALPHSTKRPGGAHSGLRCLLLLPRANGHSHPAVQCADVAAFL